jgi:hypothetical protein
MKNYFKNLLLCSVLSMLFAACGNDPEPNNCKLSKLTFMSNSYKETTIIEYNAAGKISSMTKNIISSRTDKIVYNFIYDGDRLKSRKETYQGASRINDYIFTYKPNGQIEKIKVNIFSIDGVNLGFYDIILEYNSDNRISKKGEGAVLTTYSYDNKGNVRGRSSTSTNFAVSTGYEYDDKNNFYFSVKSGFIDYPEYGSPNNIKTIITGPRGNYTYTYNANSYPIAGTFNDGNPNNQGTIAYEYTNCN